MIYKPRLSHLIALILILVLCTHQAAVAPTWSGTTLIQAGVRIIVLNSAHQNGSNMYHNTYSPAFTSAPFTALGLAGFQTTNVHQYYIYFWVNIADFNNLGVMKINMTVPSATSWRQFRISYIAIDSTFTQLKVDYFYRNSLTTVDTGIGTRTYNGNFNFAAGIGPVDTTHKISIVPLLVGIQSRSVNGEHCVYWDTKLRDATGITFNLTVDRTTRVTFFTSYILVVDRTLAQNTLEIFMDQLYIGGIDNTPTYQSPVYYNLTNIHVGLNSFRFQLIAFNFDKSSFLLTTVGYYKFLNISIWSYRKRACDPAYPYYQVTTNLCYNTCPPGYVNTNGNLQKYCKACQNFITACQTCSSTGSSCTTCYGNYVVSGGGTSCVCPTTGFYVASTFTSYVDKCMPCDGSCLTCNGPNVNQCLSCNTGKTLSAGKCICANGVAPSGACKSACMDQGCQSCTPTDICQTCLSSFVLSGARCICAEYKFYNSATITCDDCHSSCKHCSGPAQTQCLKCDNTTDFRYLDSATSKCLCLPGYTEQGNICTANSSSGCTAQGYAIDPDTSTCKEVCGDGQMITYACDDGNTENGDGCSSQCLIQINFTCSNNPLAPNTKSFCSYTQPINIVLNSTIKDIYSNTIKMNFTLQPDLPYILKSHDDLKNNIQFSPTQFNISVTKAQYNYNTRYIQVQASYGVSLQDQNITITLTMPNTSQTYSTPISSNIILLESTNKLSATYYDSSKYNVVKICKVLGMVCYIGGLIVGIILFFFRKMIGLEYVIMMQIVYFSAMLSQYSHPYLGPFQEWNYINGYNQLRVGIKSAKLVSNSFQIFNYKDYFYTNYNAMLFMCLANYGITLILYILSVLSDRSISRKLKNTAIFFGVELGFSLIMFSLNNVVVSIFLEAIAGHVLDFKVGINKFFMILTVLLVIGQTVFYILKIHQLNDSLYYYHRHKNYTHFHPLVFVIRNLATIICIVLCPYFKSEAPYIILGVQLAYMIASFAGRVFKRIIDYIRFAIVELTVVLAIVIHLVQINFGGSYSTMSAGLVSFFEAGAICVYVGMLVGLVLTIVSFIYHFWKSRTQDIQVNPDAPPEDQQGQDNGLYIPPLGNSKQIGSTKASRQLLRQKQKQYDGLQRQNSKQVIVFDVQDQQNTGQPNSEQMANSLYQYDSRRKLRSHKVKKQYRQYQ